MLVVGVLPTLQVIINTLIEQVFNSQLELIKVQFHL